ncbi:MAG: hypothetical protein AB7F96_22260 [Beijerinckiaceae bacterium]
MDYRAFEPKASLAATPDAALVTRTRKAGSAKYTGITVRTPPVALVSSLTITATANACEVSTDAGATWLPIPESGSRTFSDSPVDVSNVRARGVGALSEFDFTWEA